MDITPKQVVDRLTEIKLTPGPISRLMDCLANEFRISKGQRREIDIEFQRGFNRGVEMALQRMDPPAVTDENNYEQLSVVAGYNHVINQV